MNPLIQLGIDPTRYDLAIAVSASGDTDARNPSGGASAVLADFRTTRRFASGATMVNVRFLDVMSIAAALHYHKTKLAEDNQVYRCLILSENYDLVSEAQSGNRCPSFEWSMLDWFGNNGYKLTWQWESAVAQRKQLMAKAAYEMRTVVRGTAWAGN